MRIRTISSHPMGVRGIGSAHSSGISPALRQSGALVALGHAAVVRPKLEHEGIAASVATPSRGAGDLVRCGPALVAELLRLCLERFTAYEAVERPVVA